MENIQFTQSQGHGLYWDGSWVDSKDISWIEKDISDIRDEKLNQILNQ